MATSSNKRKLTQSNYRSTVSDIYRHIAAYFESADTPLVMEVKKLTRTREQEKKYHALINEIRQQVVEKIKQPPYQLPYSQLSPDVVKALLIHRFAAERDEPLTHPGHMVWDEVTQQHITVRPSSRQFTRPEASEFIEYLFAFGIDHGVEFSGDVFEWDEIDG